MGPAVQLTVGILFGIAVFTIGAVFAGRAEGAIYAVAALGWAALGVMLLADLLIGLGLTLPTGGVFPQGLGVVALQVGGISLALLALTLILLGSLIGVVWRVRHRGFAGLAVPSGALVVLLAGVALTAVSIFGRGPLSTAAQTKAMAFAGFGLGTLAAALIALWAVRMSRHAAVSAEGA